MSGTTEGTERSPYSCQTARTTIASTISDASGEARGGGWSIMIMGLFVYQKNIELEIKIVYPNPREQ